MDLVYINEIMKNEYYYNYGCKLRMKENMMINAEMARL